MNKQTLILPGLAIGLGVLVLLPAQRAQAFATIGGSLAQNQRDFRVYNNFSGASDNDNVTSDPMFPGYEGAVMAIWKGSIEWGSVAHGDGSGDPMQSELGSGGANFDPSFQGLATGVGGTNDNIHSEISGSNGGVLAYTETPISDGWRIRYYSSWEWADGPGSIQWSEVDLQGVACHEYGHALGLGHSASSFATMYASTLQGAVTARSITNDDRAGVQAVYGVIDGAKPQISAVQISANQITITGSNFDASGNQVWFTQLGAGGSGAPIKITNLASNGTTITANIPASAGPGDVLVRRNGTGHGALSNAWPSDLQEPAPVCPPPTNYCVSSPNSTGFGATIGASGTTSLASNDLVLTVDTCPAGKPGLFFFGPDQVSTPLGNGIRCVGGSTTRLGVQITDPLGTVQHALDLNSTAFQSNGSAIVAGSSRNFQFWYRDPAGNGAGFNLSDGLAVTFCP